jgi:histidyl-tRNA synthetase
MEERGMLADAAGAADVLLAVPGPESARAAIELGLSLRAAGLRADVFPGTGKLGAQYELAEKKRIRFAVIADATKIAAGAVDVRVLETRANETVPLGELAAWLTQRRS